MPERPQDVLRGPKSWPQGPREGHKTAQDGPGKLASKSFGLRKGPQEGSKRSPRGLQGAPSGPLCCRAGWRAPLLSSWSRLGGLLE
eukprot:5916665-Pyramimonas_sp.AAC.1